MVDERFHPADMLAQQVLTSDIRRSPATMFTTAASARAWNATKQRLLG
ncbi:MAG: hypothetical protein AB7R00_03370 [Kofleriaceae bacterium]